MENKNMMGEFIRDLRKEKGLTQEKLGHMLGVTDKAVSKWETDESNPEIRILPKLSEILGVSVDELLKCEKRDEKGEREDFTKKENAKNYSASKNGNEEQKEKREEANQAFSFFESENFGLEKVATREYVSKKKTKKGKPYIHINFNKLNSKAEGIIAIGIRAKGIISIGILSFGIVSFGLLSFGILAFGVAAFGLIGAFGSVAAAIVAAFGGVAIGFFAFGGVAIGFFAFGGVAIGYFAHTGLSGFAEGVRVFYHG
ncbi:MAG: helix-turn-helix domain-containing protein [Clostridiales bacterium]|jgi:transcriptional regulator with XRE-family HTH domain|nr:helix-turn-helix domain-containing protein [Clostridiales bacterium]